MLWVAHNIERMADRVTNIAERTAFVATGDVAAFRDRLRSQTMPV
jgi:phosphate transport system protein